VERRDLLEVIEDRYDKSSTVIATQMPTKTWHEGLGDPTIADAICDRLVHNAHVLPLRGSSMRRQKGLKPQPDPKPAAWSSSRSSLRSGLRSDPPERVIGCARNA
jgi:hypothetical protein